jgi:hypothetical protein
MTSLDLVIGIAGVRIIAPMPRPPRRPPKELRP